MDLNSDTTWIWTISIQICSILFSRFSMLSQSEYHSWIQNYVMPLVKHLYYSCQDPNNNDEHAKVPPKDRLTGTILVSFCSFTLSSFHLSVTYFYSHADAHHLFKSHYATLKNLQQRNSNELEVKQIERRKHTWPDFLPL